VREYVRQAYASAMRGEMAGDEPPTA